MCSTKRVSFDRVLLFLILLVFMTFAGCEKVVEEVTEEDTFLLLDSTQQSTENVRTTKVFRGDFVQTLTIKGDLFYPKSSSLTYEQNHVTAVFDEYLVERGTFVKKGDQIASFHYEADPIELEVHKIELRRLQEAYQEVMEKEETEQETKDDLKEQIKEKNAIIADYELVGSVDYVTAPFDGIVEKQRDLVAGSILREGHTIATIKDASYAYIMVEDSYTLLRFGIDVSVELTMDGTTVTKNGKVVSGDTLLSEDQRNGIALIQVDGMEAMEFTDAKIVVTANVIEMKDVLMVEVDAVSINQRNIYVECLNEGKIMRQYFLAGGVNSTYYWILDGLEEGMDVLR